MKHILFFILLFSCFFLAGSAFCQKADPARDITYLNITDTTLINNINKVVKMEENNVKDTVFRKGYGYVTVDVVRYHSQDTTIVYYINTELFTYQKESIDWAYPDHYGYVNNRLILIGLGPVHAFAERKYSEKSKKLIRKLVDKTLVKTTKMTFYKIDGTKAFTDKHFRLDYLTFHGGYYLYVIRKKPAVLLHDMGGEKF